MTPPVDVTLTDDPARAAITLFHEKGNIITGEMVAALRRALLQLREVPSLKLLTIEGAGTDFSFGASIPEHTPDRIAQVLPEMHRLIEDLLDAPVVTAAVVRGRCLGGGFEIALACDFIFAAEDATFGLPEIALGVFPPAASALLPLRIGSARATVAILTGESESASVWRETGLLTIVVPSDQLASDVDRWFAAHLASKSAAALRHAAAAARMELAMRVRQTLPLLERLYLADLMRTRDAAEGVAAFMAKRPPVWTDE
jgi:cyclohexa-1,5-dienecarbonyl-CoA hydratase